LKGHGSSKVDRRASSGRQQRVGGSSTDTSDTGSALDHADTDTTAGHDKWRAKEERKLQHRRQVAEHLREVADRNGNQNLRDVADRMDQKAQEHYDKQLRKRYGELPADEDLPGDDVPDEELPSTESPIDESPIEELPVDESPVEESPVDDIAGEATEPGDAVAPIRQKLTGRQNALYRQWRNEERKLAKNLAAAERLRQLAETSGDPALLRSADRLEQAALDRYTARMEKVWDFQERFGLPTPEEFVNWPTPEDVHTLPTSVEP
jgi:hypothetical protein